jgi:hypothetical protein
MKRLLLAVSCAALLPACFNFSDDLATCREQGRCVDGGPADDGGAGGGTGGSSGGGSGGAPGGGAGGGIPGSVPGVGLCDRGVCWEAPLPSSLGITVVAAAGPDDWWFGTTRGVVFHRDHGVWSMRFAGPTPVDIDQTWYAVTGLAVCGGTPWATVVNLVSSQSWAVLDGGGFEDQGLVTPASGANDVAVLASWSGAGGECAFGGGAMQTYDRPWLALGGSAAPAPSWELPEGSNHRDVVAIAGADPASLWLAITGPGVAGLWTRAADGGFVRALPLPTGVGTVSSLCVSDDGGVYVGGANGIVRAGDAGAPMLSNTGQIVALTCSGSVLVAAGTNGLVTCALATDACQAPVQGQRAFTAQAERSGVAVAGTDVGEIVQTAPSVTPWSAGPRNDLRDVWVDEDGSGWAVGQDIVLRREDGGWRVVASGGLGELAAVLELPDGGVAAVGYQSAFSVTASGVTPARLYDVSGTLVQSGFPPQIHVAALAPDGTAWAAGERSAADFQVLKMEGNGWHEVTVDAGVDAPNWWAMTFSASGEGWAAGDDARVWHYAPDGGWSFAWKDPAGADPYLAVAEAGGVVWVAGVGGQAARFAGGQWAAHPFPSGIDHIYLVYAKGGTFHAVGRQHRYTLDSDGVTWLVQPGLPVDLDQTLGHGRVAGDRGFITGRYGSIVSFPR